MSVDKELGRESECKHFSVVKRRYPIHLTKTSRTKAIRFFGCTTSQFIKLGVVSITIINSEAFDTKKFTNELKHFNAIIRVTFYSETQWDIQGSIMK